ncbi:5-dehydro-4-deoxy-D-glucuronate isomerase [Arenibacter certesii]|uniref:4-deoxy-L-threo-5-hexosulose-uronate ketol-isomerase n=1 Tax=Arenibacter certesii TaxID=228955 RepID=A0A918J0P9_9FLAO|nr:5-dehydro-4-deoxy-D-glucuronate isomerase [Arenibacter certesii]GGW42010.1 4-deoxy-L-threo-5-hexosulose-uronate ketol-isomerase [Arenibacter certesii]
MKNQFQVRYANSPNETKGLTTEGLRKEFLIQKLMENDTINLVYTHFDRYIVGGAVPVNSDLKLTTIAPIKSDYFLERREIGIINVGESGSVTVDGKKYNLAYKEALYIGRGNKEVVFSSDNVDAPAKFYLNSTPAHKVLPSKKISQDEAEIVEMGSMETANARTIRKLIVNSVVETCQVQMGMTELKTGSVWNTMPAHVHDRRMEVYFYFEVPQDQAVCHFMGEPQETRHIWMANNEAVISPPWSIHSGSGTSNYTFIWGMAGENLDYGDMDHCKVTELK